MSPTLTCLYREAPPEDGVIFLSSLAHEDAEHVPNEVVALLTLVITLQAESLDRVRVRNAGAVGSRKFDECLLEKR